MVLANLFADYSEILARLRNGSPRSEILVLGLYNPFAPSDPGTNSLAIAVNQVLTQAAALTARGSLILSQASI